MLIRRSIFAISCLILVLVISTACAGRPGPTQSPTPSQPTETRAPTRTLTAVPTETARPTFTPAATQSPTPGPTASPTPDAALSQVELIGLAWLPGYEMLLSFQFPEPVAVEQYQVKLEAKDYACQKLEKYPDRLYCIGPAAKVLTTAWVRVYPAGSSQPGFEKRMWIPYFNNLYTNTIGDNNDEDYKNFYTR